MRHHVALSIVGIDSLPECGYFRGKLARENMIRRSTIPYTILRATQFFEFVGGIVDTYSDGQMARLSPALFQPVASDDVAAALADVTLAGPINGMIELAGPERLSLDEFGRKYWPRPRTRARSLPISTPDISAQSWTTDRMPGDHPRLGAIRYEDWLATLHK